MKIGISLLNLRPGKVGGIETYMRKLVEHVPALAGDDEVIFFVHRDNEHVLTPQVNRRVLNCSQRTMDIFRALEAFTPWRARVAERLFADSGMDVMLYPQQSIFPKKSEIPSLLVVADVQYLLSPQYYSLFDRAFRKRAYIPSLSSCSHIASISQFSADHLTELCGIVPEKIDVMHLGYDPIDTSAVPEKPPVDFPYFYYPAASYPHKGHAQLFRTFARLKQAGDVTQKLVLSGGQNEFWGKLKRIIKEEGLQDDVIHLGYVSYDEVKALYAGADAVLFPTEFEGFGIPVLEAVQLKKKVICSQLPVFKELGVPDEWQIDYVDSAQLLAALRREGPTRLTREPQNWQETAAQTLQILRGLS